MHKVCEKYLFYVFECSLASEILLLHSPSFGDFFSVLYGKVVYSFFFLIHVFYLHQFVTKLNAVDLL